MYLHCPDPPPSDSISFFISFFFTSFQNYDFVYILKAILTYACQHTLSYTRQNGTRYKRPLLRGEPKVLFKTENCPLAITIQFSCPRDVCECNLTLKERKQWEKDGKTYTTCPFRRKVKFSDTLSFFPNSLASIIDDLHISSKKENISLADAFSTSKTYCDSESFTDIQFQAFVQSKIQIPYELISNFDTLVSQTTPPEPHQFASALRGTNTISLEEHQNFCDIWNLFKCESLLDIMKIYSIGKNSTGH